MTSLEMVSDIIIEGFVAYNSIGVSRRVDDGIV